jgi:hypothetical protein
MRIKKEDEVRHPSIQFTKRRLKPVRRRMSHKYIQFAQSKSLGESSFITVADILLVLME